MPSLDGHLHQDRVMIISGGPDDWEDLEKQRALYETHLSGAKERKLKLVEETVGPFHVRLIGLDGTEKNRWNHPVTMDVIFMLIDQMPMRQQETNPA